MVKPLTIQQLRARFDKEKPKFIGLKNEAGQWVVPRNTPKITTAKRMQEIEAFFKKDSTPDGVYFFVTKESLQTNSPETITPVSKGDISAVALREAPQPAHVTIHPSRTETVWDLHTAVDKLSYINKLELENTNLKAENKELLEENEELRGKIPQEGEKKEGLSESLKGIKDLAEVLLPSLDKHFSQRDKMLSLREQELAIIRQRGTQRANGSEQNTAEKRSDGGVPVADPGYEEYFAKVVKHGSDEQLDHECEYLEATAPELYKEFEVKYDLAEEQSNG